MFIRQGIVAWGKFYSKWHIQTQNLSSRIPFEYISQNWQIMSTNQQF